MSTKLTYTGAEVQELLDKIEKGDFDNAKTLEGHPASYFAIASEFTSLAESFATEQGRISFLYGYFNNGSANNALKLGGQLPTYYATATQYEILQRALSDFKSLFDSMFEKDSDGNIHAKLSLWSSGGITAGGVGSGGSGGGGGISYNRLDSWADYSADKAGYVLSALLGKDLDNRVSALANAGYVTQSALAPYALRSEIPSLAGYATESWVESKNYLTGITSSMVTNALGYTPYNSANFTKDNLKSTLGISDWALASVKPTYTASEVGALAQDSSGTNADLDTILDSKTAVLKPFFQSLTNNNVGSARKGVLRMSYNGSESQLLFDHYNRLLRYRTIGGNPKDWATIAFASDIPTKLSQLTDDVVAGNYLSKNGGTVTGQIILDAKGWYPSHVYKNNGVQYGEIGFSSVGVAAIYDETTWRTILHSGNYSDYALPITGGTVNGQVIIKANTNGADSISSALDAIVFATKYDRIYAIGTYYPGISFNHLLSLSGGGYEESPQAWIGTRLCSTKGSELASLVFATKEDTGNTSRPIERMAIMPNGNILIGSTEDSGEKLQVNGNVKANNFIGNLTGTADNATRFKDLDTSDFARFYATYYGDPNNMSEGFVGGKLYSANGWVKNYAPFLSVGYSIYKMQFNGWGNTLYYRAGDDSGTENKEWKTIAFTDSNVASATKLATPRTIWGQSFDGTSDITGILISDIWRIIKDYSHNGTFIQSKNYAGTSDLGNIFITGWNGNDLSSFNVWAITSTFNGNVAIGGTTADEKLHVHGNGKFTGALTANSLTIGGATITYDSVNEALCINGNMYALGGITAGGAGVSAYTSLEARVARLEQQLNIS